MRPSSSCAVWSSPSSSKSAVQSILLHVMRTRIEEGETEDERRRKSIGERNRREETKSDRLRKFRVVSLHASVLPPFSPSSFDPLPFVLMSRWTQNRNVARPQRRPGRNATMGNVAPTPGLDFNVNRPIADPGHWVLQVRHVAPYFDGFTLLLLPLSSICMHRTPHTRQFGAPQICVETTRTNATF